MLLPSYN